MIPAALHGDGRLCRRQCHAAVDLDLGRCRRHGRRHAHPVPLDLGADRHSGGALCRPAVLPLGAEEPARGPRQYGCADQPGDRPGAGAQRLSDGDPRRECLFRCRGGAALPASDRPLSRFAVAPPGALGRARSRRHAGRHRHAPRCRRPRPTRHGAGDRGRRPAAAGHRRARARRRHGRGFRHRGRCLARHRRKRAGRECGAARCCAPAPSSPAAASC